MRRIPPSAVVQGHPDFKELASVRASILRRFKGGVSELKDVLGAAVRDSIDGVVNTPKTGRRTVDELEKTEKTYLGTRVEIELRALLGVKRGVLDLVLDGVDVDVKFTIGKNWMIPSEALNEICVVIAADETNAKLFMGLIKAKSTYLNGGGNRDGKRSLSAQGFQHILWLLNADSYPQNFWRTVDPLSVEKIFEGASGSERIATLFRLIEKTPIPRSVIADVAKQQDFMKRVRANGGARDLLDPENIVLLHGLKDAVLIRELNLPLCTTDEFISKRLVDPVERRKARLRGYLPH